MSEAPPPSPGARGTRRTRPRRAPAERLAAWYVTGPLGHLVAGVADWAELLGRYLWARARGREPFNDAG